MVNWIDVKDALPNKEGWYIVCYGEFNNLASFTDISCNDNVSFGYFDGKAWVRDYWSVEHKLIGTISKWSYLPNEKVDIINRFYNYFNHINI